MSSIAAITPPRLLSSRPWLANWLSVLVCLGNSLTTQQDFSVTDIVLAALNAKYIHAAFGLRYLLANLGPLREAAAMVEFDINQRPVDIAEALLARKPK